MAVGRRVLIRNAALLAAAEGCARRIDPATVVPAGVNSAGQLTIAAADATVLQHPGGSVSADVGGSFSILVANLGTALAAYDGKCPHQQCDLTWVPEDKQIECPCHGSRFASDGAVLNPPASTELNRYPVQVQANGDVVVTLYPGDGTFPQPDSTGKFTMDLAGYPALAVDGGVVHGRAAYPPGPLLVTRISATQYDALNGVCPHLSCSVQSKGDGVLLRCPCHGSQFHLDGGLVNGPAVSGLVRYQTTLAGQQLTIDLSKTV